MRISDWSSDVCSSDLLGREVELGARLEDQPLGDALIVVALQAREHVALVGEEQRALYVEPIGRQPLEPDRGVGTRRIGLEVIADARLEVEVGTDGTAVE